MPIYRKGPKGGVYLFRKGKKRYIVRKIRRTPNRRVEMRNPGVSVKKLWSDFRVKYKNTRDIGFTPDNLNELKTDLRKLYESGVPVPVEPHESTILNDKGIKKGINKTLLRSFSVNREEHLVCHNAFDAKLQKLLNNWIDLGYDTFNEYISSLNNNIEEEFKNTSFLGDYTSGKEAYINLRKCIFDVPAIDHDVFAWRGVGMSLFSICNTLNVGDAIGFSRLMACSVAAEVSYAFADALLFLIELPKGTNLLNLTCIKESEPEFILPDRCCFKLVNRIPFDEELLFKNRLRGHATICESIIHIKLFGIYNEDKSGFEKIYDNTMNIEELERDMKNFTYY